VWLNPWSNNRAVMIFVKAIDPGHGRRPAGVLYLEFDWEALMADVLLEGMRVPRAEDCADAVAGGGVAVAAASAAGVAGE